MKENIPNTCNKKIYGQNNNSFMNFNRVIIYHKQNIKAH